MKFLTPLLCLLFAQGIAIAQEPAELTELRQTWETATHRGTGKSGQAVF